MPLWQPYDGMLDSKIADMNNVAAGSFAGSITCALFLKRFVDAARRPGRISTFMPGPVGQAGPPGRRRMPGGARALRLLCERYG